MRQIEKELTCFYSDGVEYQTCQPVANEAAKRGYKVLFTDNKLKKAEIGLYCQHVAFPQNSKLSVVMLHDMAQQHGNWPNIWKKEPWDIYSIGVLPGPAWEKRWEESSVHPFAHPKLGVIRGGWPKADYLRLDNDNFSKKELRKKFGIEKKHVILYAPSWEYDCKQDEFVKSLYCLDDVELILKQAPWSEEYSHIIDAINAMNAIHENFSPNVHIIDSKEKIFDCIKMADIIVSDESSVMFEGLLLDVPSIAVIDWMIPDQVPPRLPSIPYDFVKKTTKSGLKECVSNVLSNIDKYKEGLFIYKENNFYNYLNSSARIMDVIDNVILGKIEECEFIESESIREASLNDFVSRIYWDKRRAFGLFLRKIGLR